MATAHEGPSQDFFQHLPLDGRAKGNYPLSELALNTSVIEITDGDDDMTSLDGEAQAAPKEILEASLGMTSLSPVTPPH